MNFNQQNTYDWYLKRVYKIDAGYDNSNKTEALQKAMEWGDKIPLGIIYRENRSTFENLIG